MFPLTILQASLWALAYSAAWEKLTLFSTTDIMAYQHETKLQVQHTKIASADELPLEKQRLQLTVYQDQMTVSVLMNSSITEL